VFDSLTPHQFYKVPWRPDDASRDCLKGVVTLNPSQEVNRSDRVTCLQPAHGDEVAGTRENIGSVSAPTARRFY
jgi:hypothetical protein